jgi:hypothetical protein
MWPIKEQLMATKRKATASSLWTGSRFIAHPSLAWIFGAFPPHAFDSERGVVQYLVTFINGEESAVDPDPEQIKDQSLLERPWVGDREVLQRTRAEWRTALRRFVAESRSKKAATLKAVPMHLMTLTNISVMPRWEGSHLRRDLWVPVDSPDALRGIFWSLLMDESSGIGAALCQCRLKSCKRFFLEQRPSTGRPQRLYCSRDHMLEAHAARQR